MAKHSIMYYKVSARRYNERTERHYKCWLSQKSENENRVYCENPDGVATYASYDLLSQIKKYKGFKLGSCTYSLTDGEEWKWRHIK